LCGDEIPPGVLPEHQSRRGKGLITTSYARAMVLRSQPKEDDEGRDLVISRPLPDAYAVGPCHGGEARQCPSGAVKLTPMRLDRAAPDQHGFSPDYTQVILGISVTMAMAWPRILFASASGGSVRVLVDGHQGAISLGWLTGRAAVAQAS
jgi:hypothetical protein